MNRVDKTWLFCGVTLIALSLGLIFFVPYQTVNTASNQTDQMTGSITPTPPDK